MKHFSENTVARSQDILLKIVILCILLFQFPSAPAQDEIAAPVTTNPHLLQVREQLENIQHTLRDKQEHIDQLRSQLKKETEEMERRDLERQIAQEESSIFDLKQSFENIALGGLDLSIFQPEAAYEKFDWKNELQLILKPIFQKLKEVTDKPRQIERLKSRLGILDNQARTAQRAIANIENLLDDSLDKATRNRLEKIRQDWSSQLDDIGREHDITGLRIKSLQESDDSILNQIQQSVNEFFTGRGLNLVLMIIAFAMTLLVMKWLYLLYLRVYLRSGIRGITNVTSKRMLEYSYQGVSLVTAILVSLLVLYLLGDTLLLVLALLLILVIALSLRNYLPQFMDETKLLLNIGAVRERERVIYKGLPWMIRSIGMYSKLYNPALDGLLRLPVSEMLTLVSRPYREDEPWFPTKPGDWVEFADGTIGQVALQTPEVVQLRTAGAIRTYVTTDFLAGQPRNLSEGFGVSINFGIDYRHQADCTTKIPQILRQAIERGLQQSPLGEHVQDIMVEFQEAAASSLNYKIYVTMKGAAADSTFAIFRLLQRICVDTCNEQGWVIPFNQLTINAGTGFDSKPVSKLHP